MFGNPFEPPKRRKNDPMDPFGGGGMFGAPEAKKKRDSRRSFTQTQKNAIWSQQNGKCARCKSKLDPIYTEYDHGKEWADGGKTTVKNGRALCANCHKIKTHKTRLKKVDSKRKKPKKPNDPFSGGLFGGGSQKPPRNPFGF